MATHEIQISHTEIFKRVCLCDGWKLHNVADNSILMEVPASSILQPVLDLLAQTLEFVEVDQAIQKVSVETTLQMMKEGKQLLASIILGNIARLKEGK